MSRHSRIGLITALPLLAGAPLVVSSWALDASPVHLALELSLCAVLAVAAHGWARRIAPHEEARREQEFVDSIHEPLLLAGEDGRILVSNLAAKQAFGPLVEVGAPIADLLQPGVKAAFDEAASQIANTGVARVAAVVPRAGSAGIPAVVHGARVTHLDAPAYLLGFQDVSERSSADDRLSQLSRDVLGAQEEERTRMSRDLHDGLGQIIAAAHFELGMVRTRLTAEQGVDEAEFARATALIEDAGEKLRRICRGLRPPMLDDLGLVPALLQLVDEVQQYSDLEIDLETRYDEDVHSIPTETALCVFRVLQEALTNVQRHAAATRVAVTLSRDYQWLVLSVYDNGAGFDARDLDHAHGFGVKGMRERARLVQGEFELRSEEGQGTRVTLKVPVPRKTDEEEP